MNREDRENLKKLDYVIEKMEGYIQNLLECLTYEKVDEEYHVKQLKYFVTTRDTLKDIRKWESS